MAQVYIRRTAWFLPAFLLVFAGVAFSYVDPATRQILLGHLRPVVLVGLLLFLAYCVGMKLLRLLGVYPDDAFPLFTTRQGEHWLPAERPAQQEQGFENLRREILSWEKACFATGLGLGVLAYGTFLLALLQNLSLLWVLIGLACAALCVPGEIRVLYRYFQLPADWRHRGENQKKGLGRPVRAALWVLIVFPVVFSFLSALAPPHQSDALRYHLAVPARYVDHGGWFYIRDSAFSNFPFTVEMLYTLALTFGEDVACRLLHFSFFGLTLLALYALGRRLQSSSAGLLAAAIFACTPFVPILASWAFIELGMTYYYLLVFYALAMWVERQFQRRRKKGWLGGYRLEFHANRLALLLGIFCGLALGIKFTSLFLFVYVAVVMVAVLGYRTRQDIQEINQRVAQGELPPQPASLNKPCSGDLLSFGYAALLVAAPWYLKSLIVTGNPFFPFLNSIFQSPDWSSFEAAFYRFHAGQKGELFRLGQLGLLERLWDLIRLPWRATVEHLGNWQIGPLYLIYTALLVLFVRRLPRTIRLFLWSSLYFFLVWAYTYRDNRFLLPVLVLLAAALGVTYERLWRRGPRRFRLMMAGLLLLLAYGCGSTILNICVDQYPFAVVAGKQSREDFLSGRLDYWPAFQFLNQLPENSGKVIFAGEYRPYYCRRDYLANDWFNTPVLIRYLRECEDLPALAERLKSEGVRYVLVNERELAKGGYGFFYHFHFLSEADARAALELYQRGQLNQAGLWARVTSSPLYRDYREFLDGDRYLRRIYPSGPGQEADIVAYELL